ncbi:MAG: hypothetical protein Ct9H90mP3_1360 [Flammeovirgaceae bacterium]|nr:MAG: hypothetical protein Ct9H90mP3_1360 [Flammeovirgaceae bacterium]
MKIESPFFMISLLDGELTFVNDFIRGETVLLFLSFSQEINKQFKKQKYNFIFH